MVMRNIQWSVELVTRMEIVPRLEDHLIDDLFYQDDEIGEMRYTAFMVKCGLEEDPPDGPDVAPLPWGDMLLLKTQEQEQNLKNNDSVLDGSIVNDEYYYEEDCSFNNSNSSNISLILWYRLLPSRSGSKDDIIDTLASRNTSSNNLPSRSRSMDDIILLDSLATEPTSTPQGRRRSLGVEVKESATWKQNVRKLRAEAEDRVSIRMSSPQPIYTQYAPVA
jgi:hypothetical protein